MSRLKKYVIILDAELRASQRLIQYQSDDLDWLKKRRTFDGNPQTIPRSDATIDEEQPVAKVELIHNVTQTTHGAGIYKVLG